MGKIAKILIPALVGAIGVAILSFPYVYAHTLPVKESIVTIVEDPQVNMYISQDSANKIRDEQAGFDYVTSFHELTPDSSRVAGKVDCGSYAILVASELYQMGYDPIILSLIDINGDKHLGVIYNDGNGFGSIGGLEWDDKPPIYDLDTLIEEISEKGYVDYDLLRFSPDIYSGNSRIQLMEPSN